MSFELEKSINNWRNKLLESGSFEDGDVAELEDHLRIAIEKEIQNGQSEEKAFNSVIRAQYSEFEVLTNQYSTKREVSKFHGGLLANYFKVGFRTFGRNRTYFGINLLGLVIGLTSVFSILLYLQQELNFDTHHENHSEIHRIVQHYKRASGEIHYPIIPPGVGPAFADAFPEIKRSARLRYSYNVQIHNEEQSFYEEGVFFAEPHFLEMFSFDWQQGDPKGALSQVNTVVLTKSMATKYFGNVNPIGQIITFDNEIDLKVIGIIGDVSAQSHFTFDFLISFDTFKPGPGALEPLTSWRWLGFLTYIQLAPGTDLSNLEMKMAELADDFYEVNATTTRSYELQPLKTIYLDSGDLSNPQGGLFRVNDPTNLRSLGIIAALILLIAFFNYYNISTSMVRTRTCEMGVRKVFGATRRRFIQQMSIESFTMLALATTLSWCLVLLMSNSIEVIPQPESFVLVKLVFLSLAVVVLFTTTSGLLLGGSYSIKSTLALLQNRVLSKNRKFSPGNLVLMLQFGISAAMIMVSLIVVKQISFFSEKDLGYNHDGVLVGKFRGEAMRQKKQAFVDAMEKLPDIVSVSYGPSLNGSNSGNPLSHRSWPEGESVQTAYFGVDYEFGNIIDLEILDGRYFSREFTKDSTHAMIINETLAKRLGFEDPIGQKVTFTDPDEDYEIIGVFKNFHYKSLHHEIGPMALKMWLGEPRNVLIRYNTENIGETLSKIETVWNDVFSDGSYPLDYRFLDEQLESLYSKEQEYAGLLKVFTGLAIFTALLGLFGLSSINIDMNLKQIGIRRVLGAQLGQIAKVVSVRFMTIVALGILLAVPVVYLLMGKWLSNFAYSIDLGFSFPVITSLLILVCTVGTLSFQVYRVMTVNPSSILRDD